MAGASRREVLLRNVLQVGAAALYGAIAIAIVWGGEPGSLMTQLTGSRTDGGPWAYAAAVALMVGGVALLDAEVAPVASVALTGGMLAALAFAPLMQGATRVVVMLLAVAAIIAWLTRDERRALCTQADLLADEE